MSCAVQAEPEIQRDFCLSMERLGTPHKYSEATLNLWNTTDPEISKDRKYARDVAKTYRCRCTEDQEECPQL